MCVVYLSRLFVSVKLYACCTPPAIANRGPANDSSLRGFSGKHERFGSRSPLKDHFHAWTSVPAVMIILSSIPPSTSVLRKHISLLPQRHSFFRREKTFATQGTYLQCGRIVKKKSCKSTMCCDELGYTSTSEKFPVKI